MTDVPNWIGLLVASGGGFVAGITLTVACRVRVAISIGKKYLSVPRWSVIVGAIGAVFSVIGAVWMALVDPSAIHMAIAGTVVVLFGVAGVGAGKSVE